MRTPILFVLLVGCWLAAPLYAQTHTDSLEARLSGVTGAERLAVLAELVEALHRDDPPRAITYGREAMRLLADDTDPDFTRRVWYWKGQAHRRVGQYDSVLVHGEHLRVWAEAAGDARGEADGSYLEGLAHRLMGSYAAGLASLDAALSGYEALDLK
ncbi:MAG: hypothetical protein IH820_16515 [Bacteroidetes bacterium]|nr:hypothetical protein [Bacteroidota bacterium]